MEITVATKTVFWFGISDESYYASSLNGIRWNNKIANSTVCGSLSCGLYCCWLIMTCTSWHSVEMISITTVCQMLILPWNKMSAVLFLNKNKQSQLFVHSCLINDEQISSHFKKIIRCSFTNIRVLSPHNRGTEQGIAHLTVAKLAENVHG